MNFYRKNESNLTCEAVMHVYKYQPIGSLTGRHLTVESNCQLYCTVFTANLLSHSNVFSLCNKLLDCFQQYILKYAKNFFLKKNW